MDLLIASEPFEADVDDSDGPLAESANPYLLTQWDDSVDPWATPDAVSRDFCFSYLARCLFCLIRHFFFSSVKLLNHSFLPFQSDNLPPKRLYRVFQTVLNVSNLD